MARSKIKNQQMTAGDGDSEEGILPMQGMNGGIKKKIEVEVVYEDGSDSMRNVEAGPKWGIGR